MAGIKDYSTTQANNTSLNGINTAEGMLPSNLNNAIRALMKNTREFFNDSQWVEYGDGDGVYVSAWVSTTQFTIASATDITAIYHVNRRLKILKGDGTFVYGTITASSNNGTLQSITSSFDSGNLGASTNTLRIFIAALSSTNNSIPLGVIGSTHIADGSITTAKLANDAVNNDKIADNAVQSPQLNTNAITEAKIIAGAVTTTKIGTDAIITSKILDNNVTTSKIPDNAITTAKINADAVNGSKIADDSIDSEHLVDGSIDSQHIGADQIITSKILDSNITTAKINNDAVTIDKIADAAIVVASEQSGHTPDDNTFYTTSSADTRFLNKDTSELINSGQSWSSNDNFIATTAAIDARVIDLVDDVGGFVPIANETSFPNVNPDVNNGVGTIVSIEALASSHTANGSGVVTIANGTVGNSTVTLNGCGNGATLPAGFGILVESTTTQHTYNFHRLVPKATEVSSVAAISSAITGVNNISSAVTSVNNNSTNINTVAGINSAVTNVSGISTAVSAVNSNSTNINAIASNLAGSNTIGAVGGAITNVNNVGGSITNVNTCATNLTSINSFANTYSVGSSNPTSGLNAGDLFYNTSSNTMLVYNATSGTWQNAGSSVNGTQMRWKKTVSGSGVTSLSGNDDNGVSLLYDANYISVFLNGSKLVNGTDVTVTSGNALVFAVALTNGDIVDAIATGTFSVASFSANAITSGVVATARGGTGLSTIGTAGQALKVNAAANGLEYGSTSSAEVYGFSKNSDSQLIITTTNQGADSISSSTFATFDDTLFSASGFVFSINNNGDLIATI